MSVSSVPEEIDSARTPRRGALVLTVACAAIVILGIWASWKAQLYKTAMEEIETEITGGRYAIACRKLDQLLTWSADPKGGLVYLLGSCELARGRQKAAGEAWARVVPGTAFSDRAIRGRARLFRDAGQFAAAEQFLQDAARDPRNDRTAVLEWLVPIYADQGRVQEAARIIEDRWIYLDALGQGTLEPAIKLVRQHVELTLRATPAETIRASLEKAAKLAPDDDRVWLGRANLAIRTKAYDEAARWLDACQRRRPDDVAVWRARLDLSMATDQTEVVKQAMTHLKEADAGSVLVQRVSAWFARGLGDIAAERRQLEQWLELEPADLPARDRLIALENQDRNTARAAELVARKTAVDRLLARYQKLHDRKQPIRDAAELASLAEQLGRHFEARGFRAIERH